MNFEFELGGVRRQVNWIAVIPAVVILLLALSFLFGGGDKVVAQKPTATAPATLTPSRPPTSISTATREPTAAPTGTATVAPTPTITVTSVPPPTLEAAVFEADGALEDGGEPFPAQTPAITASPTEPAPACRTGMEGQVLDSKGGLVSGAVIQLYDGYSKLIGEGSGGNFAFPNLRLGMYQIVIKAKGWPDLNLPINLFGCDVWSADFTLQSKGR